MKHMLRSPTLVGHAHLGGVTVRDDQGQPVQMAEPLVTDDERELIAAELNRQQTAPRERLEQAALVGGVVLLLGYRSHGDDEHQTARGW